MTRLELDGRWTLTELSPPEAPSPGQPPFLPAGPLAQPAALREIAAEVPGSVLDAYIKAGLVPDPYYGENEKTLTPLFEKDFAYSRTFNAGPELLAEDRVELAALGIDTLGEIFINGTSIAKVNNMHRAWRFDVKPLLVPGENAIRIVLFSPIAYTARAYREGPVSYINTGNMAGSGYLRKAHSQFGWDWGPMLPDAGIWRSICLEGWSTARLADVYITQEHAPADGVAAQGNADGPAVPGDAAAQGGPVRLRVRVRAQAAELRRFWAEGRRLKAALRLSAPSGETLRTEAAVDGINAAANTFEAELSLTVEKPRRWWPRGLGPEYTQALYGVELELLEEAGAASPDTRVLDVWRRCTGLRTMTISTEEDSWGKEFALTVNGVKLFALGADYIPEDSVFPRIKPERTRRLLEQCAAANFNSIRVWGGGYYPDDYFYDACDELGLVVWQDCMFACNIYELTGDFAANVTEEIRQNMIRLRHHPSLGLWCGNNEMELAWIEWDNVRHHSPALRSDYIKLFEALIPGVWKEADPGAFYWPASPSSGGGFDDPNNPDRGDVHFWEVWHGLKPFSEYRRHLFRYCSEFGFESLPDTETIDSFAAEEDKNLFSPVMEAHQRCPGGNGKILYYLSETYRYPKDFESLVYISQVLQMESIQSGVDHWRRNRGRCMGALYWQLNDCWPVASWSSIDYYGRWKALHYGARRFFAPLRATVFIDETEAAPPGSLRGPLRRTVRVFVHNDTMKAVRGKLSLCLRDRDFTVLAEESLELAIPALSASEALVRDYRALVDTPERERSCFVRAELRIAADAAGTNAAEPSAGTGRADPAAWVRVSGETALFVQPKYFSFEPAPCRAEVRDSGDHFTITIRAGAFCRFVRVKIPGEDIVFSDNFVDITGPEGVELEAPKAALKKTYSPRELERAVLIMTVADTY